MGGEPQGRCGTRVKGKVCGGEGVVGRKFMSSMPRMEAEESSRRCWISKR
jgi:hypothetical protein